MIGEVIGAWFARRKRRRLFRQELALLEQHDRTGKVPLPCPDCGGAVRWGDRHYIGQRYPVVVVCLGCGLNLVVPARP